MTFSFAFGLREIRHSNILVGLLRNFEYDWVLALTENFFDVVIVFFLYLACFETKKLSAVNMTVWHDIGIKTSKMIDSVSIYKEGST